MVTNNNENDIYCDIYLRKRSDKYVTVKLTDIFKNIKILNMEGCLHDTDSNGRWLLDDEGKRYIWKSIYIECDTEYKNKFLSETTYNSIDEMPKDELQNADIVEFNDIEKTPNGILIKDKKYKIRKGCDKFKFVCVLSKPMTYNEIREEFKDIRSGHRYTINIWDNDISRLTRSHFIKTYETE